jgi:diguanylate cyclase
MDIAGSVGLACSERRLTAALDDFPNGRTSVALPRARSLRARILWLVLLAVIPALGAIVYGGIEARRQAASRVHQELQSVVRTAGLDQQRLIVETRQILVLLSQLPQVRGVPEVCGPFLTSFLRDDSPYSNLGVIHPDGRLACSAIPFEPALDLSDRAYFQRAIQGEFSIGDYQVGRITGLAAINFGYPLEGPGGDVEGVVYAAVPLSWLQERMLEADLPPGSSVVITDAAFTVLASLPPGEHELGESIAGSPLAVEVERVGGDGTFRTGGPDGIQRLVAVMPLVSDVGGEVVYVSIGVPARAAFAAVNRALVRDLLALLLLTLLVSAAAWWGSGAFVLRPLRGLLGTTRRLAEGDLSARTPVSPGGGEVAELATSFNGMADALEERERQTREHLERIARLNRVYAVLSGINAALLRLNDRAELLEEVCRIAVEQGQFRIAAVHEVDPGTGTTRLAFSQRAAGEDAEWIGTEEEVTETELHPLVDRVLREGCPVICNGFESPAHGVKGQESSSCPATGGGGGAIPKGEPREAFGYRSAAAFPLRQGGELVGVVSLYAAEPDFFDEEEIRLLRELAADTSLGLEYLEKESRLQYLANHDTLTDLPNRGLFEDRLCQALLVAEREEQHLAVLLLGIEPLPEINSTLGHATGDSILRSISDYLAASVPHGATVARIGGNELGIVVPDLAGIGEITTLAAELSDSAPRHLPVEDQEIYLSLRTGVAVYPDDGKDAASLIRNAALARQAPPAGTGNTVTFFSPELNARAQHRREIERELRHAVERNELVLLYQPVVDLRRREVIGVEALVRWKSQTLGDRSPAEFIPIAEEAGLIGSISEWIIRTACSQGHEWCRHGMRLIRINVNVSVPQLAESDFVERITKILGETRFDPQYLALGIEITETQLMENLEAAVGALGRFRQMGVAIYIDDFGTGYSSLSYLRQLPIDTLKIDASFVRDIPDNPDAVAVVRGIIAMAKSLDLRVIAEGVETEAQLAVLDEMGCDAIQGYLFSRPVPPEEVESFVREALALPA